MQKEDQGADVMALESAIASIDISEAVRQSFINAGFTEEALRDGMAAPRMRFEVECFDSDGNLRWREDVYNLVTTAGKTAILDTYLKGSAYTAAWYLLLKGAGTISVSDTLASHGGWTELGASVYSGNRPAITWGTTSAGSNTSTAVSISVNGSGAFPITVAGAGCCTVNTGTAGTLYNAADFSSSRSVNSGDTLNVTVTLSVS